MSTTTILIDGDIVAHRTLAAATTRLDFGDGPTTHVDLQQAFRLVDHEVREALDHLGADRAVFAMSVEDAHWRRRVFEGYKSRRKSEKPDGYREVVDYIHQTYRAHSWPPLEGDDVLGILATATRAGAACFGVTTRRIILSIDKDMRTLPCRLARSFRGEVETITEEEADYNHLYQTLVGDTMDDFPGCPGIGPVRAKRLLDAHPDPYDRWHAVVRAFEKRGLTEDDALAQARCARILRWGEYDFEAQEPILWDP